MHWSYRSLALRHGYSGFFSHTFDDIDLDTDLFSLMVYPVPVFQQGEEGDMQLLGTAYSASQMDNVQIYLEQGNSIPGFLSRITLDLYSKQTMMAS